MVFNPINGEVAHKSSSITKRKQLHRSLLPIISPHVVCERTGAGNFSHGHSLNICVLRGTRKDRI